MNGKETIDALKLLALQLETLGREFGFEPEESYAIEDAWTGLEQAFDEARTSVDIALEKAFLRAVDLNLSPRMT